MNAENNNPCRACTINQDCCTRLSGLMLTPDEFESNFKDHAQKLTIVRTKKYYIVSTRNESACPHWKSDGCSIYDVRPIDCQLFPYVISRIYPGKKQIKIEYRKQTHCPQKDILQMTEAEARALILAFAQDVYGSNRHYIVSFQMKDSSWIRKQVGSVIRRIIKKFN